MYAAPPSHSIQLNSSTFTFIDALGSIFDPLNDNHPTAMLQKYITYYVFHGRVTLFFANNFLTQRRIPMKFLHNFFKL